MNEELIAEAEIGEEARAFLQSELGRCLVGMAQQDAEEAREALATVDPTDIPNIRRLQNQALLGRRFEQYLAELVQRGNNALAIFKQQREAA